MTVEIDIISGTLNIESGTSSALYLVDVIPKILEYANFSKALSDSKQISSCKVTFEIVFKKE